MNMFTEDDLENLIEAVQYKSNIAECNDPKYDAGVWKPLLRKLLTLAAEQQTAGKCILDKAERNGYPN